MNKKRLLKVIIDNKLEKELAQLLYDTKKEGLDEIKKYAKNVDEGHIDDKFWNWFKKTQKKLSKE